MKKKIGGHEMPFLNSFTSYQHFLLSFLAFLWLLIHVFFLFLDGLTTTTRRLQKLTKEENKTGGHNSNIIFSALPQR